MARDISESKRHEEALLKWEYVFEHAGWGVVLTDPSGGAMESVNAAFAAMHGYHPGELLRRPLADMRAPEALHVRQDGSRFPVLTDESAFKDQHGQVLFRAYYFQDVSEHKLLET